MFPSSPSKATTTAIPAAKRKVGLKLKLTGIMLLTIGTVATIVHIPWAYTSRRNIDDVVSQLHDKYFQSAQTDINSFVNNVANIKQTIVSNLDHNLIELEDPEQQGLFYLNLLQAHEDLTWVQVGFANGDFLGAQRRDDDTYNLDRRQWDETLGLVGEAGSELAKRQAERAERIAEYATTQQWDEDWEQAQKTVETYRFGTEGEWEEIKTTQRDEVYYAPIRPYYRDAIAAPKESVWTNVYIFNTDRVVGVDSAVSYSDPGTDEIRGVISTSVSLRRISELLSDLNAENEGLIFIVDHRDHLIGTSDPSISVEFSEENNSSKLLSLPTSDHSLLQVVNQTLIEADIDLETLDKPIEFSQYDPATRQRYYVGLKPLGQLGWVVGSITPESAFLGQADRNQRSMLMVILLLLGLCAIILSQISDRMIIRPILAISDAAQLVRVGSFSQVSLQETAQREDELGRLAEVFQTMTVVIGDREKNLITQLEELRDNSHNIAGSQLEISYYESLKKQAAELRLSSALPAKTAASQSSAGSAAEQFPPPRSLKAYYQVLKDRAKSVRNTRISSSDIEHMLCVEEYLANLPKGDLRELASLSHQVIYQPDQFIYQEGDTAEAVYVVVSGAVELTCTAHEQPLRTLQAGQIFGDLCLMLDVPHTTFAKAVDSTVIFTIKATDFTRILRKNPHIITYVEQKLVHRQAELTDAHLWFSEDLSQDAHASLDPENWQPEDWSSLVKQQLKLWWHGMVVEV